MISLEEEIKSLSSKLELELQDYENIKKELLKKEEENNKIKENFTDLEEKYKNLQVKKIIFFSLNFYFRFN